MEMEYGYNTWPCRVYAPIRKPIIWSPDRIDEWTRHVRVNYAKRTRGEREGGGEEGEFQFSWNGRDSIRDVRNGARYTTASTRYKVVLYPIGETMRR